MNIMKSKRFIIASFFAAVFLMLPVNELFSQRGQNMGRMGGTGGGQVCSTLPGITQEQRSQLNQLRTEHLREMQSFRDQIDTNRAKHRELMKCEDSDRSAIDALQNERNSIRQQMEQRFNEHNQNVRNILTEEQRAVFDSAERGGVGLGVNQPSGVGRRNANIR